MRPEKNTLVGQRLLTSPTLDFGWNHVTSMPQWHCWSRSSPQSGVCMTLPWGAPLISLQPLETIGYKLFTLVKLTGFLHAGGRIRHLSLFMTAWAEIQQRGCQQQLPNDCGVHAIANAVTLARGANPSLTAYDKPKMRSHLKQCFVNNDLSAFPTSATKNNAVFSQSSKL